jgi:hypothetical protein
MTMQKNSSIKRYINEIAFSDIFSRQMRFIAGPRQVGKTTIAKIRLSAEHCDALYYNWDKKEVRDRYRKETDFLAKDLLNMPKPGKIWACFDEIHKMPKWKNILKDFFDTYEKKLNLIVTGSAKLDMLRRAGDSLAGRYLLFKMNPLILSETLGKGLNSIMPESDALKYIEKSIAAKKHEQEAMENMLKFSGFPEPLVNGNEIFSKKWHNDYLERVVKEDLRDISAIHQLEKVMDLIYLLPSKISAPLSINSLKEDLELNFNTVKNYINYLILTYVLFEISPYHKKKTRLVKKEKKVYFFDWAMVDNEAARFENYVAMELKTRVDLWNDSMKDTFGLNFVKMRNSNETDFLITKNSEPYLLIEAKSSATSIDKHHYLHSKLLGDIPFVQLTMQKDILKVEQNKFYVVSASRFFS